MHLDTQERTSTVDSDRQRLRPGWGSLGVIRPIMREFLYSAGSILALTLTTLSTNGQSSIPVIADATGSLVSPANFTASNVDAGMVFGQEYLSRFHSKIMSGTPPTVIFSGDSTTEGAGITDKGNNLLSQAFQTILLNSLSGVRAVNSGHSGMTIHQWVTTYLAVDLEQAPDLYVLRWGLNPNTEPTFEQDLREGLRVLRTAHPVDKMSVLLMTPNACNDTQGGRGVDYLNRINPVIRRAARDFRCVFIDLARNYPDAFSDPLMMDDPYGDGRRIHPRDVFNQSIVSLIAEVVLPQGVANFGAARLQNLTFSQLMHGVDAPPFAFNPGLMMQRATLAMGWPLDGAIVTERQADGIWRQANYGFSGPEIRTRTGGWSGWNEWGDAITVNPTAAESKADSDAPPTRFPSGLSIWVATSERGWPHAGQLLNVKQFDGATLQINSGFDGTIAMRSTSLGNAWNGWKTITATETVLGTPSATIGDSAGPGASVIIEGTDLNGTVTLRTGDDPLPAGELLHVAWGRRPWRTPYPVITPANAAAAAVSSSQQVFVSASDTNAMTVSAGMMALSPRTTYRWNWLLSPIATMGEEAVAGPRLAAQPLTDGGFELVIHTTTGQTWLVEKSADLTHWEPLGTLSGNTNAIHYRAAAPPLGGQCFFRLRAAGPE